MRMRPEAERRLREGFQRRVDEQTNRYAAQLAQAGQLAARFDCGELVGVFSAQAGGDVRPGKGFWRGREPKRQVWLYAFTGGFMLLDSQRAGAPPVRWSQVTEVTPVWRDMYGPGEDETPIVQAYRLRTADNRLHEISRDFRNVQDPYREVGKLLRGLAPGTVGKTMPRFPTIDEIIARYTGRPGGRAGAMPAE